MNSQNKNNDLPEPHAPCNPVPFIASPCLRADLVLASTPRLCACGRLSHPQVKIHQMALLLVGNLSSKEVDSRSKSTRRLLRGLATFEKVSEHLFSTDRVTLLYALGSLQNMCSDSQYVDHLQELGAASRLRELTGLKDDDEIVQYARGCMLNVRNHPRGTTMRDHQLHAQRAGDHLQPPLSNQPSVTTSV